MEGNIVKYKDQVLKYLKIFGVAISSIGMAFYIVAASPLNPRSLRLPDIDSSIFIYFGYGLRSGKVPYADMVDHKGPLLWTIEWLGLALGNGEMVGIWFLEWAMMSVDLVLLFLAARFFVKNKLLCLFAVGLSIEPLIYLLQGGNFSEEWALPFILFSLLIFMDYFVNDVLSFFRVLLCGMCMGAVLCIRPNMIGLWIAFVAAAMIRMSLKKEWRSIVRCMVGFLLGIGVVILPYVIYFIDKGALKDMWEWSISKNIGYVEAGSSSFFSPETIKYFWNIDALLYIPFLVLAVMLVLKREFNWLWGSVLFYIISLFMCTLGGRTIPHYAIVLIPCLILPMSYVIAEIDKKAGKYHYFIFLLFLLLLGKVFLADSIAVQNSNIKKISRQMKIMTPLWNISLKIQKNQIRSW